MADATSISPGIRRRLRSPGRQRGGRVLRALVVSAGLALLAVSCKPASESPNLVLIVVDTLRRDHLSAYGYERDTTPNLQRLARRGLRFDLAYSPSATTGPSHATLFTSLSPMTHDVVKNGLRLRDEYTTLAEILQGRGYQTAAVVSSFVLDRRFGYAQGFEVYRDDFDAEASTMRPGVWEGHRVDGGFDRRASATSDRAVEWLHRKRDAGRPFFLFVHYFDPHSPYEPPEPFRFDPAGGTPRERLNATLEYDGEIAFTDYALGRLLDSLRSLGLADGTLVVVTGDHGEGLMEHGHPEHGVHIYEEAVGVPLIMRWPGRIEPGRRIGAPVQLVDLAPTLLDLLDLEVPPGEGFQGRSVADAVRGESGLDPQRPVFLFRRHYEPGRIGSIRVEGVQYGIRRGRWKYIERPAEGLRELFDLVGDPGERTNLAGARPETARELAAAIRRWRARSPDRGDVPEIPEADRRGLEALGYTD